MSARIEESKEGRKGIGLFRWMRCWVEVDRLRGWWMDGFVE